MQPMSRIVASRTLITSMLSMTLNGLRMTAGKRFSATCEALAFQACTREEKFGSRIQPEKSPSRQVSPTWFKRPIRRSPSLDAPGTERARCVPGFGGCAPCFDLTPSSEVRAVCGNAARTDPRGGRSAMAVPTATRFSCPLWKKTVPDTVFP
jgi:hypothetical protein